MRKVRDPKIFERVVRSLPNHAHGADGAPQGDCFSMASTANTTREFVVDGVPCATGVVLVGDAWGFTNPSIGRGYHPGLDARGGHRPGNRRAHRGPAPTRRRVGAPDLRAGRQMAHLNGGLRSDSRSRGRGPLARAPGSLRSLGPVGCRTSGVRLGVALRPRDSPMVLRGGRLHQPPRRGDTPAPECSNGCSTWPSRPRPTRHRGRPGRNWRNSLSDLSKTRAVFVHGNPETSAIWGPLLAELHHSMS